MRQVLNLNANLIPLDFLDRGACGIFEAIEGSQSWTSRLAELGVRQGCRFEVVQPGRPCILLVAGCRLCLRGEDTSTILVRPVEAK